MIEPTLKDPTPKKHLCNLGEEIPEPKYKCIIAQKLLVYLLLNLFKPAQRCDKKSFPSSFKKLKAKKLS